MVSIWHLLSGPQARYTGLGTGVLRQPQRSALIVSCHTRSSADPVDVGMQNDPIGAASQRARRTEAVEQIRRGCAPELGSWTITRGEPRNEAVFFLLQDSAEHEGPAPRAAGPPPCWQWRVGRPQNPGSAGCTMARPLGASRTGRCRLTLARALCSAHLGRFCATAPRWEEGGPRGAAKPRLLGQAG